MCKLFDIREGGLDFQDSAGGFDMGKFRGV